MMANLKMPDRFASLANDKSDLVAGNHHLEKSRSVMLLHLTRWATLWPPVALISDDVVNCCPGITKNHTCHK